MMETKLWTSPHVQEKVRISFKFLVYYNTWICSNQKLLRIMDGLNVHYVI